MNRFKKHIITAAVILLSFMLFISLASVAAFVYFNSPPHFSYDPAVEWEGLVVEPGNEMDMAILFEVRRGESAQSVGRRLAESGIIRNRYFWNLYSRMSNEHIKIGNYRIEIPASQIAIHQLLVAGRQILQRVTIPEGFTILRMARLLEDAGICAADDFIAAAHDPLIIERYHIPGENMEGYLFPDTYLFPTDFPAARVVETMADTFFARIIAIDENFANLPPEELNDLVTLASIIEREYRMPDEAPVMAGVFSNRLRIGMALQSCATVEYIITEVLGRPHPEIITFADIAIRHPFNTYIHPGLPPGPISAPGVLALRAAMFPEETQYLYFRLMEASSGRHYFSRTYDEHIRAGDFFIRSRS